MLKTMPQVVLYKLWCTYIHLFCLEQGAASCFLLFVALPPPAVDTESPEGHAHQELLSPHQKHRLPATAEGKRWLRMTRVRHLCCVNQSSRQVLPCLIQNKDAYLSSCQQFSVFQNSFYPFPVDTHPIKMKLRQQQMHNNENGWRICGGSNLSSLFGTGLCFFTCSLFILFSLLGSLFFFSFSVPLFFFLDLSKKQIKLQGTNETFLNPHFI